MISMGYREVKSNSDKQSAADCDKRAAFVRSARRFRAAPGRDSALGRSGRPLDQSRERRDGSQAYIDGLRLSDGGEYAG